MDGVDLGRLRQIDVVEDVVPYIARHWLYESIVGPESRLAHPHRGGVDGRYSLRGDDPAPAAHLLKTVDVGQADVAGDVRVHVCEQDIDAAHALATL